MAIGSYSWLMAEYFSAISQEYEPIAMNLLPERVQTKMREVVNLTDIPHIEAWQVWENMKKSKKTKSVVPGELPARLRHEFGPELAGPAATIFNNIAQSGEWVTHWKHESAIPLKKVDVPENEGDVRLISITHHLSLQMEKFVLTWLHKFIGDKLDRDQFGGAKGHSVAHYLIEIINFILYNQDLSKPLATLLTAVDLKKGFNKIYHSKKVTKISDMGAPGWLTKIIFNYLSGRSLSIRYKSETSESKMMPGGTGAGTILGLELFLVMFNEVGPTANTTTIGETITKPLNSRQPILKCKAKWIDDMTVCNVVHQQSLVLEDRQMPQPVPYHSRTGHRLPTNNPHQLELDCIKLSISNNKMAINTMKTKSMLCSTWRKYDFQPEVQLKQGENLEVVQEIKLVGYMLRSDLKTCSNTTYIIKKAYKRMWIIRRLKTLGASTEQLLDVLNKQVLSVLSLGAPAWYGQLTMAERTHLNRVLRCGLHIIYGDSYRSFSQALTRAGMISVTDQLHKMTAKFANRAAKHSKFSKWFKLRPEGELNTRCQKTKYLPVASRTARYGSSPLPYLTAILNEND